MWFTQIKSENLKQYLRGIKILEEKQKKYWRKYFYLAVGYLIAVEAHRDFFQEEWERKTWVPEWVLHSRREHYINYEYYRLKAGLQTTFSISNWDTEAKMVYHVDTSGRHRYEKIILPSYSYGKINQPEAVEKFYRQSVYNIKKDIRNDLDNYLRHKTVTLGDWLIAVYYYFNIRTKSFDPFFYKPEFLYHKDREALELNLQTDNKPKTIERILRILIRKLKKLESLIS
jgi:hypothetical protein